MPPRRMPWFRFYCEALSDRKMRRLTPAGRWLWVAMLSISRESVVTGLLLVAEGEPMDDADLADVAAIPIREVRKALPIMEQQKMIERDAEFGAWRVINWDARQFKSDDVTARTEAHRARQAVENVPPNEDGTFQRTFSESDSEPDSETSVVSLPVSPEGAGVAPDDGPLFPIPEDTWSAYAEAKLQLTKGVKEPMPWKRKVARNASTELAPKAHSLLRTYDLNGRTLAKALLSIERGEPTQWLNYEPKRAESHAG